MTNFSREEHPVKAVCNIETPVAQARRFPKGEARGIDFTATLRLLTATPETVDG